MVGVLFAADSSKKGAGPVAGALPRKYPNRYFDLGGEDTGVSDPLNVVLLKYATNGSPI